MELFLPVEDPRHSPNKRHSYAKDHAFPTFTTQKSVLSGFITTPPISKPQYNFPSTGYVANTAKLYQDRQRHSTVFASSEKSAFTKLHLSSPEIDSISNDPPAIVQELPPNINYSIVRPKPRYATSTIDIPNANTVIFRKNPQLKKDIGLQAENVEQQNGQECLSPQQSEPSGTNERLTPTKKRQEHSRSNNFKDILNSFQMASDRALRQQRARSLINTDYTPNQGIFISDNHVRSSAGFSPQPRFQSKRYKDLHLGALTITIPAVNKTVRQGIPARWMNTSDNNLDSCSSPPPPPSPTLSGISMIPPSPPRSSDSIKKTFTDFNRQNNQQYFALKRERPYWNKCAVPVRRYSRSVSRTRASDNVDIVTEKVIKGYVIRCSSTGSDIRQSNLMRSRSAVHSPHLPPSEPQSSQSDSDDDMSSIVGLYKQMTGNHYELLTYASSRLVRFFRTKDLPKPRISLNRLRLDDLIYESTTPVYGSNTTYFFDAFLPHDNFLSTAITLMAEPLPRHYAYPLKQSSAEDNIWSPPAIAEIRSMQDEVDKVLRGCARLQSKQRYRMLVLPRYYCLDFESYAAEHSDEDNSDDYERRLCFILLQLLCALKSLQSDGIETLNSHFSEFLLLIKSDMLNNESSNDMPRLLLLKEALNINVRSKKSAIGLCNYALNTLFILLHLERNRNLRDPILPLTSSYSYSLMDCAAALDQDKSSSLTEAKNALECGIFIEQGTMFESEDDAHAWIDAQRAEYVTYLFREVLDESSRLDEVYERLHLQFLLTATPAMLLKFCDHMRVI